MKLELQRFDDPDLFREATGEFLTSHIESYSHLYGLTRAPRSSAATPHRLMAAVISISTLYSGWISLAPVVERAGEWLGSTQSSQAEFIAA